MFYTTSIISEEATTFWIYILDYKLSVVEFSQICHTRTKPKVCCKHCLQSHSGRDHEFLPRIPSHANSKHRKSHPENNSAGAPCLRWRILRQYYENFKRQNAAFEKTWQIICRSINPEASSSHSIHTVTCWE